MNDRTKELIKYWGKGFVIMLGAKMIMTLINVSVNEEIISQFWQGFIVATSGYIYIQKYHQQKKQERIDTIIKEINNLVEKYEDTPETGSNDTDEEEKK